MSTTTNLDTLVINYLTQAQYNTASSGGTINENQLYLTPQDGVLVTTGAQTFSGNKTFSGTISAQAAATDGTTEKITNIKYGSDPPTGSATTGTVYFQTGASAYTFQPRVNLTRNTTPGLPATITTTEQTMYSFTLPPGLYLITFQINHGTYTAGTCRWDLKAGSNTITQVRTGTGMTSAVIQNGCGLVQCVDSSTTISFSAVVSSGSMTTGELHYSYIKLF